MSNLKFLNYPLFQLEKMDEVFDIHEQDRSEIKQEEISAEVKQINLANNKFRTFPPDVFNHCYKLTSLILNHNEISNLEFLSCFKALLELDFRNNQIEVDDILAIKHIYILFLRSSNNRFNEKLRVHPLSFVVLLPRVWIFDGTFITDYIRNNAAKFRNTLAFSETVLNARRTKQIESATMTSAQLVSNFLAGSKCNFGEPGLFITPQGSQVQQLTDHPQIKRIQYLAKNYPIELQIGTFKDYFSLVLGILSKQWMNLPISYIPRLVARQYWGAVNQTITQLEEWQYWVLLLKISENIKPETVVEKELWAAMRLKDYLQTGKSPKIGSIPRMIISSFLFRCLDSDESIKNDDVTIYEVYRSHCGFTSLDESLDIIHQEILTTIQTEARQIPQKGETIAVTHPLKNKWVNAKVNGSYGGRVEVSLPECIFLMPISALFWDGRGVWREAKSRSVKLPSKSQNPTMNFTSANGTGSAFITESITRGSEPQKQAKTLPPLDHHIPSSIVKPPKMRVAPSDSSPDLLQTLFKTGQKSPTKAASSLNTIAKTPKVAQFRGIPQPRIAARSHITRAAPKRKTDKMVTDVVNIVNGGYGSNGQNLRKFHVKMTNQVTNRSDYVWINEDEIPTEDVVKLLDIYADHIKSKMLIIEGH